MPTLTPLVDSLSTCAISGPLANHSHDGSPSIQANKAQGLHAYRLWQLVIRESGSYEIAQTIVDQDTGRDCVKDPLRAQGSLALPIVVVADGNANRNAQGRDNHKCSCQEEVLCSTVPSLDKQHAQC